jgi:hypothetical protein
MTIELGRIDLNASAAELCKVADALDLARETVRLCIRKKSRWEKTDAATVAESEE